MSEPIVPVVGSVSNEAVASDEGVEIVERPTNDVDPPVAKDGKIVWAPFSSTVVQDNLDRGRRRFPKKAYRPPKRDDAH